MIHNGRSIIQEMQQEGEQKEIENREGKRAARRRRSQRLDFRGGGAPQLVTQCTRGAFTLAEAPHAERRGRALGIKVTEDKR